MNWKPPMVEKTVLAYIAKLYLRQVFKNAFTVSGDFLIELKIEQFLKLEMSESCLETVRNISNRWNKKNFSTYNTNLKIEFKRLETRSKTQNQAKRLRDWILIFFGDFSIQHMTHMI